MPSRLTLPGATYFGPGALDAVRAVPGARALIVTDPHMRPLGILDRVTALLHAAGTAVTVYEDVVPDPTRSACERAAARRSTRPRSSGRCTSTRTWRGSS